MRSTISKECRYVTDYYAKNRERILQHKRNYYQKYRERIKAEMRAKYWRDPLQGHGEKIKNRYGLTRDAYQTMLDNQGRRCAACGSNNAGRKRRLAVDHDHVTGVVRGLLCIPCNCTLGYAKDSPAYLQHLIEYRWKHNSMAMGTGASEMPSEKELE